MPVIKRYPNRKLYDTEAKQYVTLEGVAELIRQGEEVQVMDHATGEDLTALTLTQIIFEQEKKQSGFLPRSVLASLIQAGGGRFSALQRTLSSSKNFFHQMDAEIRNRIQALISQGELTEGEGRRIIEKLLNEKLFSSPGSAANNSIDEAELQRMLDERQVPSREDMRRLNEQLDMLAEKLKDIKPE